MTQTPFIRLLGNSPLIRILNHLLIFREFDYSMTDIAKESGVAWSTLCLLWSDLEKDKIVEYTRDVGKAKMYRLNMKNPSVKELAKFADKLVWNAAGLKAKAVVRK